MSQGVNNFIKISTSTSAEVVPTRGHFIYVNSVLAVARTVVVRDNHELASEEKDVVEIVIHIPAHGLFS